MIRVRVQTERFDVGAELAALENSGGGAIASFTGLVRSDGGVDRLTLEHYPGMTEAVLERLACEAVMRWSLLSAVIVHRVGTLTVGERIVLVATSAPHRHDALAACAALIDQLKTDAPFWKHEARGDAEQWVAVRVADDMAAARWNEADQA